MYVRVEYFLMNESIQTKAGIVADRWHRRAITTLRNASRVEDYDHYYRQSLQAEIARRIQYRAQYGMTPVNAPAPEPVLPYGPSGFIR